MHFHLGELVRVAAHAPSHLPIGEVGTITRLFRADTAKMTLTTGVPYGHEGATVEFGDGEEFDFDLEWLEPAGPETPDPGQGLVQIG